MFGGQNTRTDFSRHMPVLAQAAHDILLGIYWRLSKQYEKENIEADPHKLAYAVTYYLTQNKSGNDSLGDFPRDHSALIAQKARQAAADGEILRALSLEYAGRLMAISWNSGSPSSEEYLEKSQILLDKASDLGIVIENIVALWGAKAIVNLQAFAKEFHQESL